MFANKAVKLFFFALLCILLGFSSFAISTTVSDTLKSPRHYGLTYGDSQLTKYKNFYKTIGEKATLSDDMKTLALVQIFLADIYKYEWNLDSVKHYVRLAKNTIENYNINDTKINFEYQRCKTIESYLDKNFILYLEEINFCIKLLKQYKIDSLYLGDLYYQKRVAFSELKLFDSAIIYLEKSQNTYPDYIKKKMQSNYHRTKSEILEYLDRYEEGFHEIKKALSLIQVNEKNYENANIFIRTAKYYSIFQDYQKALEYYFLALQNFQAVYKKDNLYTIPLYAQIAHCYYKTNNYPQAIEFFNKALPYTQKHIDEYYIYNLELLALSYKKMDSLQQADTFYQKAITTGKKQKHYSTYNHARRLKNYGDFTIDYMNDPLGWQLIDSAFLLFYNLSKEQTTKQTKIYEILCDICYQKKQYHQALVYCNKGIESNINTKGQPNTNNLTNPPEVQNIIYQTILLNWKIKSLSALIKTTPSPSETDKYIDELKQSITESYASLNTSRQRIKNNQSKYLNTENQKSYYQDLIQASLLLFEKTNDSIFFEKAYQYAIANKAATLQDMIRESDAKIHASIPDSLINIEQTFIRNINVFSNLINNEEEKEIPDSKKINDWKRNIFNLNFSKDSLIAFIEKEYPVYYSLKYDNHQTTVKEIQQKLTQKQTHIEYFIGDNILYTFVLTNKTFDILSHIIDQTFFSHLQSIYDFNNRAVLSNFDTVQFNAFVSSSSYLYQILIEPVSGLAEDNELIINPDDQLWYLPFEILLTADSVKDISFKELPYLIKSHPVRYSYSTNFMSQPMTRKLKPKKNLLIVVPVYDEDNKYKLKPLNASIQEAEYIQELTGGDLLYAGEATEKMFNKMAQQYSIIHLAMHTIINNENPQYSKLAFTEITDSIEDNYLNTYEIYNQPLNAQMIVLSSCNSGAGKMHKGEGIINMAKGFFYAGCPSLLITLWEINDKASAQMMKKFYSFLKQGMNKSKALQQAKINFMEDAHPLYQHPHFWASYTLLGNEDPIEFKNSKKSYYIGLGLLLLFVLIFRKKIKKLLKSLQN